MLPVASVFGFALLKLDIEILDRWTEEQASFLSETLCPIDEIAQPC